MLHYELHQARQTELLREAARQRLVREAARGRRGARRDPEGRVSRQRDRAAAHAYDTAA
ncbi:hypothetical protein LRS74_09510 [Streptomyces sp. LX-29]|uniref:hypothetical protein n=1 Tax=Streptomyces sp. LX-29 TaxID=2900152 RepID=UPI00240DE5A0|nr:hypothetical protein [Streptomyces sp. LX-29]WFB07262.1 hypothetical protein LRS74_09510 [Streptomyces sp. LX-29]